MNYSDKNYIDFEWGGGLWVKYVLKGKNGKYYGG